MLDLGRSWDFYVVKRGLQVFVLSICRVCYGPKSIKGLGIPGFQDRIGNCFGFGRSLNSLSLTEHRSSAAGREALPNYGMSGSECIVSD